MKRTNKLNWLFAALFFCAISQPASSQTLKDVFTNSETPIFYLGIDFTKARIINDPGANAMDIRNRLFASINSVVVNEPKKYDIAGAFHKGFVGSDLSAVNANNEKINAEGLLTGSSSDFNRLKESDIMSVVKALNLGDKKGLGFLFVMEGMKKDDKKGDASIWATIIDMKTKKVLLTERFESRATGIGFRNFWASTIKETLDEIEKKKYKDWKKTYGG